MSSMNFTLPPVRKAWMWLFWKLSTFLRYLRVASEESVERGSRDLQIFCAPLHLFYHVQGSVNDELIHMFGLL
jgi:hypothetical protein